MTPNGNVSFNWHCFSPNGNVAIEMALILTNAKRTLALLLVKNRPILCQMATLPFGVIFSTEEVSFFKKKKISLAVKN